MKGRTLIPCAACARHVGSDEQACPFCGAARLAAPAARLGALPRGTSRAAAFGLRAVLVTAAVGCAASHDPDEDTDAPGNGADAMQALDAGATHDAGNPHDAQLAADARVADAGRDAAPEASAGDAALDILDEDAFVPIPIYGGVFPDPRTRAKV